MKSRRHVLALVGLALAGPALLEVPTAALAGETRPFSDAAFEAAQKGGKPVLIAVSAPWCPICRTQKPILAKLAAEPRFKDLQIFDIDLGRRDPAGMDRGPRREDPLTDGASPDLPGPVPFREAPA